MVTSTPDIIPPQYDVCKDNLLMVELDGVDACFVDMRKSERCGSDAGYDDDDDGLLADHVPARAQTVAAGADEVSDADLDACMAALDREDVSSSSLVEELYCVDAVFEFETSGAAVGACVSPVAASVSASRTLAAIGGMAGVALVRMARTGARCMRAHGASTADSALVEDLYCVDAVFEFETTGAAAVACVSSAAASVVASRNLATIGGTAGGALVRMARPGARGMRSRGASTASTSLVEELCCVNAVFEIETTGAAAVACASSAAASVAASHTLAAIGGMAGVEAGILQIGPQIGL
jgi:hypothetical protein